MFMRVCLSKQTHVALRTQIPNLNADVGAYILMRLMALICVDKNVDADHAPLILYVGIQMLMLFMSVICVDIDVDVDPENLSDDNGVHGIDLSANSVVETHRHTQTLITMLEICS